MSIIVDIAIDLTNTNLTWDDAIAEWEKVCEDYWESEEE
jgi:hypothetical protein